MAAIIEQLGSTNLEVIREMLLGNKSIEQAANEIKGNDGSGDAYGPDTTAWLYTRYDKGHPTCVKIARRNARHGVHAALQLFVREDDDGTAKWYVEPFLLRSEFVMDRDRYVVVLNERWIHLLLSYVEDSFGRLRAGSGLEQGADQDRLQEQRFEVRVRRFKLHGPKAFFVKAANPKANGVTIPDPAICGRWEILSRWDDWNRAKMGMEMRLPVVRKLGYDFAAAYFKKLCVITLELHYQGPGARKRSNKK